MKAISQALLFALFSTGLLTGCGQKGPLYLPGEAPQSQTQGPFGRDSHDESDQSSKPGATDAGRDLNGS